MPEQRILLVEDEATTRAILTEVLRAEGYAVDSVATAAAATTCLQAIFYESSWRIGCCRMATASMSRTPRPSLVQRP